MIYLDYAATTPVDRAVLAAVTPYFCDEFYNPSSAHALGRKAFAAVEAARDKVARAVNAAASEIVFTSGGSEAIELAMLGANLSSSARVVISAIEHESVKKCAEILKDRGAEVVTVMPTADGIITPDALKNAIGAKAALVCVMTVNNQTGAVQPVKELARIAHERGALFFTDAVQAAAYGGIDVKDSDVDMLAASGHKFYSLKGGGFLYIRNGVKVKPLLVGGDQENGMRAGTENVPAIVAMGEAIELAVKNKSVYQKRIADAESAFLKSLGYGYPILPTRKIPGIVTVVFPGVNGGRLAVALSINGVCCSVGSACTAGSAVPPPTLVAMGVEHADQAVRFSFGRETGAEQAKSAAAIVNSTVKSLL